MPQSVYDYDHAPPGKATHRQTEFRRAYQFWFIAEAISVVASYQNFTDATEALHRYFAFFESFRRQSDFQTEQALPRPVPLNMFVDKYALYGHFRAWLRFHEIDPDAVTIPDIGLG